MNVDVDFESYKEATKSQLYYQSAQMDLLSMAIDNSCHGFIAQYLFCLFDEKYFVFVRILPLPDLRLEFETRI